MLRLGARLPAPDSAKSIDGLLHSLALDQGARAVGIILSGTGTDGTAGLRAIKEHGGATLVQLPDSAAYDSMPRSAIAAGVADQILTPEEMPQHLIERAAQPAPAFAGEADALPSATADAICDILRIKTGHEFAGYKRTTLVRRISRRMDDLRMQSGDEYLERLEQDASEAPHLFKEMLIGVTSFFRDPSAVAEHVLPVLLAPKAANDRVRLWVVGCATGEEAYSLAILLRNSWRPGLTRQRYRSAPFQIMGRPRDDAHAHLVCAKMLTTGTKRLRGKLAGFREGAFR